jgi:protein-disulfide isomerase
MTGADHQAAKRGGVRTLLRAGGRLATALFSPSGGWARPHRRRTGRFALLLLLAGGGAAAAYAAVEIAKPAAPAGDRAAIDTIVRDYILEHPEIITEAMKRLQARQVADLVEKNRDALEQPYAGAWEGAEKPEVTLVAFMDYACGYCRAALPDIARLLAEDPKLRVVYHELPVIAEGSAAAARVSLFAAEKGRFAAFHKAMYAQGGVDEGQILAAAREAGLDAGAVKGELANKARNTMLAQSVRLAQALEATGTPMFVVGDQVFYGAVGYEGLKAAVAEARAKTG